MMSMMTAVFAYSGADMSTAAGESENPEKNLPRAIKISSFFKYHYQLRLDIVCSSCGSALA